MTVRYSLTDGNAVEVFYDDSTVPSLFQPHWPNGDTWADAAEATAWAELYVASLDGYPNKLAPNARGEEGANQPSPAQAEAIAAAQASLEAADDADSRKAAKAALEAAYKAVNP